MMTDKHSTGALREVCEMLHALRDDNVADASIRDADSVSAAVTALVRDYKRPVHRDYVGQLLTKLANALLDKIVGYNRLQESLDNAREHADLKARQYEEKVNKLGTALGAESFRLAHARAKCGETCEDLADMKACVRALRKRIEELTAPPEEHG